MLRPMTRRRRRGFGGALGWGAAVVAAAPLAGCGPVEKGAAVGGESHFLGGCGRGCDDGLSCLAGVCTRACVDTALDCSDLGASVSCRGDAASSNEGPYCDLPCTDDDSCQAVGSQLECRSGFCRGIPSTSAGALSTAGGAWWCLDQEPPPLQAPRPASDPVMFVLPVVEWGSLAPLRGGGLTATLCAAVDFTCRQPLFPPYVVGEGSVGATALASGFTSVPVPEGFDGFIKFEIESAPDTPEELQFMPFAYYLSGPVMGDVTQVPPLLMVQRRMFDSVLEQSFPGIDAEASRALGSVDVSVYDCNGEPVSNARVELNIAGQSVLDLIPFQLPASGIPIMAPPDQPLYTSTSGRIGYFNAALGAVQLRAYRRGDTEPFGSVELGSVAEQFSGSMIRPRYFTDAHIPSPPGNSFDSTAGGARP
jgi:hypothetical protein